MEDAGRGRGRNVPVGRGAQLLAALQAKTRALVFSILSFFFVNIPMVLLV